MDIVLAHTMTEKICLYAIVIKEILIEPQIEQWAQTLKIFIFKIIMIIL